MSFAPTRRRPVWRTTAATIDKRTTSKHGEKCNARMVTLPRAFPERLQVLFRDARLRHCTVNCTPLVTSTARLFMTRPHLLPDAPDRIFISGLQAADFHFWPNDKDHRGGGPMIRPLQNARKLPLPSMWRQAPSVRTVPLMDHLPGASPPEEAASVPDCLRIPFDGTARSVRRKGWYFGTSEKTDE